jgi:hypothetical protein
VTTLQRQSFTETISCLEDQPTNFRLKTSSRELPDAQAFREEKKSIKATLNKMGGPLRSLDPILFEGQLRVGGRIGRSDLNFEAKHQTILPASHPAITMLINYAHKKEGHVGVDHTLNLLRQKYWIIHGREQVRKVIKNCRRCQHMRAPFLMQQMAPLPQARVSLGYAFETVGLDLFGPLYVGIGRGQAVKHYGIIFTCVRMRAVHLELVENQSSTSFINALMRFRARRGDPREIYSDNGKNFEGASKEIKQWVREWDQEELRAAVKPWGVTWHFNPPEASHRGGVFESLIRPCRRILEAISSDFTVPSRELMVTLLTEVERIMNNRPLCKISNDPKDPETLTPAMLLTPRANWSGWICSDSNS